MDSETSNKLVRCFSSVFPVLTEEQIRTANLETLLEMDSLAAVNLLVVIDEEFSMKVDRELLLKLGSFDALQVYLEGMSDPAPQERADR